MQPQSEKQTPLLSGASIADARAIEVLLASARIGLVTLDADLRVSTRTGKLVDWIELGRPVGEAVPALFGYEELLAEIVVGARDGFSLPRVRFSVETGTGEAGTGVTGAGVEPRLFSIRAFQGAEAGCLALLFQDVTELGAMEQTVVQQRNELALAQQALREAKEEADAANRAKSAFLANVSHELRTPLNVIIGNAEILRDRAEGALAADLRNGFLADIHDNGVYLLELINDLLDLSKAEAGRIDLIEEVFALDDLLAEVIAMVEALPDSQGLSVIHRQDNALPGLCGDRLRVKQILINLLGNAVKFTGEGGTIEVGGSFGNDGRLTVTVRDSGAGMTAEELARIGEPYAQGHLGAKAGSRQGTGLGLHLVSILADLHGATVSHSSVAGEGTEARLSFPSERTVSEARDA